MAKEKIISTILYMALMAILFFGAMHLSLSRAEKTNENISGIYEAYRAEVQAERALAKKMAADGAEVYLDGQKVDMSKINLDAYGISIRDNIIILWEN